MWQRLFSALFPDAENLLPAPAQQQAEERIRHYWLSRGWELMLGEIILWTVLMSRMPNAQPFGVLVAALFGLHLIGIVRDWTALWLVAHTAFFLVQGTVISGLGAVTALAFLMPYTFAAMLLNGRERLLIQTCCIIAFWVSLVHEIIDFGWQIVPSPYIAVSYNILVAAFTFQTLRYLNRLAIELNTVYIAEEVEQRSQHFLARISHELRTPLNSVLGFARLLRRTTLPEPQQGYLHQIIDEGEHLNRLVSDLLDSAHLATGKVTLNLEVCDVNRLCEAIVNEQRPTLPAGVTFNTDFASDLPVIQADQMRLRQIITNLVGNAVKYTSQGEITLRTFMQGQKLLIEVRDTGMGIPEAQQALVFVPFVQLDNRRVGVGLGLDIAMRLAMLHGGTIQLASVPGQGSTFTVELPV